MPSKQDLRTKAFVLKRTNYGETDRIINFLTSEGKKSAIAKGVRKEKSKLAGGVEMFCLSEIVIHQKNTQNSDQLGVLTQVKMLKFYQKILTDLARLELASSFLKQLNNFAESGFSSEYFSLLEQSLEALNQTQDGKFLYKNDQIESWFLLNLAKINGDTINLLTDTNGHPLDPKQKYSWDVYESSLTPLPNGNITANHIKLMRLSVSAPLQVVLKVKNTDQFLSEIIYIAKSLNKH